MSDAPAKQKVQKWIKEKPIFIAAKSWCPHCAQAEKTIDHITKDAFVVDMDLEDDGDAIQEAVTELTGQKTIPNIFIGGEHIGGNDDLQKLKREGKLQEKIDAALK